MGGCWIGGLGRRLVLVLLGTLLALGVQPALTARAEPVTVDVPVVTGTGRVGAPLVVDAPDPSADYQWYRAGQPITGADQPSYVPVAADAGQPVWVRASVAVGDSDPVSARSRLHLVLPDWEQHLFTWGESGPDPAAPALDDVVAIAAGRDHYLALREDQTVTAWGENDAGQATVPGGLTDVVAIAAGSRFSTALRADGTVTSWGNPSSGRTTPPAGLDDAVAIASGLSHSLALRSDGTVVAWGFGNQPPFTQTLVPDGLDGVVAISGSGNHSLALRADGTVTAWGYDYDGQSTVPAGLADVVAIAGTNTASAALHADGTVTTWGQDSAGIPADLTAIALDGGEEHLLALRPDGTIAGWGYYGGPTTPVPEELTTVTAVSAGDGPAMSMALARAWTGTPGVTGTAKVGRTLSADPGDWVPGAVPSYQWLRDGEPITGATAADYTATPADLGARLSVRVSGQLVGVGIGHETSEPSAPVEAGTLDAPTPKVSGTPASGRVLTATGAWPAGTRLSYRWLRNGTSIKGATDARYRLTSKDVGTRISVRVTGKLAGYDSRTLTSARTAKVMKAGVPTIRGTRATGSTLTVSRGSWTSKTKFSYQWLRDGSPIRKATGSSYRLTSADAGRRITVKVTGRRSGYATVAATSAHTTRILKVATPRVKGIREVGRLLRVEPGAWSPGTSFSYRWYANGRLIPGARSSYLWASSALRGKRITVTVTGRRTGFATVARGSAAIGPIR